MRDDLRYYNMKIVKLYDIKIVFFFFTTVTIFQLYLCRYLKYFHKNAKLRDIKKKVIPNIRSKLFLSRRKRRKTYAILFANHTHPLVFY